jgi:hypothetical protein
LGAETEGHGRAADVYQLINNEVATSFGYSCTDLEALSEILKELRLKTGTQGVQKNLVIYFSSRMEVLYGRLRFLIAGPVG